LHREQHGIARNIINIENNLLKSRSNIYAKFEVSGMCNSYNRVLS